MNIQLTTVHFSADQKLVDFVNKKVPKLETFFDAIIGAEVILKLVKPEAINNKVAGIKLLIPGYEIFAEKQADTFEEAVDLAVDAVKKQLGKYKDKQKG